MQTNRVQLKVFDSRGNLIATRYVDFETPKEYAYIGHEFPETHRTPEFTVKVAQRW